MYTFIDHGLLSALIEGWHSKISSFHLSINEMSITLDDVSSFIHLPISGRLLNYFRLTRPDTLDIMMQYLGADPGDAH